MITANVTVKTAGSDGPAVERCCGWLGMARSGPALRAVKTKAKAK